MFKTHAIEDAQEKANISKQPQIVFRCIDGVAVEFDYTHQSLWDRRRHKSPTAIMVTTVTPVITGTD